ncbi:glycoside hydrolase family 43 protein [Flavobacterium agrisoli]|uniref:Glycoside hydrolase 43 family protein n=1 Tax=Flavobacterium agrisoli TaxID=2793066 RepID=A0A934PPG7_9FLAO|nr:glycoside hydrolase 43 family protein [Flavobacterium agrisoli]MBK0370198.1 glycoside hydrolase 43 family protein [Flavobacterium agrisoli]
MKFYPYLFSLFTLSAAVAQNNQNAKPYVSNVWVADLGNGNYQNPILQADYSDPDVVRVGDDYYMTASSFNCTPGLPILHSKDMVNWKLVNHALAKVTPLEHYNSVQHGNAVWAPSIRYHNKEFYIYWGDPDFGIFMVKTKNPLGKWEAPVLVMEAKGIIDTCPFWDEDGRVYLSHGWAGSRAGVKSLLTVKELNAEGTAVIDEGHHVYDGHEIDPTVEGSKLYKKDGYYYIFAPAGGVSTGWQIALRSKNIYGPYERKIVLEQGKSTINGPHQGAWVDTPQGESWFYHFQDIDAYGRIVHLQPMSWQNGWPIIGKDLDGNGIGEPVMKYKKPNVGKNYLIETPQETDYFTDNTIGLQWQWQANPNMVWYAKMRDSDNLRLFSMKMPEESKNLWLVPNLLLQKFPALHFSATTKIKLVPEEATSGKSAGLLVMGLDYASVRIIRKNEGFFVEQLEAKNASKNQSENINASEKINQNEVYFKVEVKEKDKNAICEFSYSLDGKKFLKIGKPFTATPGKWIGAKVGLYSVSEQESKRGGYADVDWFKVEK